MAGGLERPRTNRTIEDWALYQSKHIEHSTGVEQHKRRLCAIVTHLAHAVRVALHGHWPVHHRTNHTETSAAMRTQFKRQINPFESSRRRCTTPCHTQFAQCSVEWPVAVRNQTVESVDFQQAGRRPESKSAAIMSSNILRLLSRQGRESCD